MHAPRRSLTRLLILTMLATVALSRWGLSEEDEAIRSARQAELANPKPAVDAPEKRDAEGTALASRLEWPEGATVTGRVLDHSGEPVANAEVLLLGEERIIVEADRRTWFTTVRQLPNPLSVRTDRQGSFAITRKQGAADRLAVIAEDPLFWVVPRESLNQTEDGEVEVRLPAAGSLAVQCDLPGKPDKLPLMIESKSLDGSFISDSLRLPHTTYSLKNPGETVFEHLPPGEYVVQRYFRTKTEANTTLTTGGDRQIVAIESQKRANIRFERKRGQALSGVIRGLEDVELRYAYLTISHFGPEEGFIGRTQSPIRSHVAFDVIPITSNGQFTTDPIPPGEYSTSLFVVRASTPQLSRQFSDFSGDISFTVPETGDLPELEIVATANPKRDLSKVNGIRIRIINEEGQPVAKPQAMVQSSHWRAGGDGLVFLSKSSEQFGDVDDVLDVYVRADGYASTFVRFAGAQRETLRKGEATITLRRGQKVQLQFNVPQGMTWPEGTLPEACFDELWPRAQSMRRPASPRDANHDFNMLNLREVARGRFEFQLADDTPRFHVAVHAPGFLQCFEAGSFTLADVKNGNLQIDLPRPATVNATFRPGDYPDASSSFQSASLNVIKQLQGRRISVIATTAAFSTTPQLKLTDLAPGNYIVEVRTQPRDGSKPLPDTTINLGKYYDSKFVTLKEGQSEQIDFRSVPYDPNAFRGTRTAVIRIKTPDGQPAKGRNASVTRYDGHYGSQVVFSGTLPESGEIVLNGINDAKRASRYNFLPYLVRVDDRSLGTFGFTQKATTEEFEFTLVPDVGDMAPDVSFSPAIPRVTVPAAQP